jgi:hypothetical protein
MCEEDDNSATLMRGIEKIRALEIENKSLMELSTDIGKSNNEQRK